jgi:hypothetical protein
MQCFRCAHIAHDPQPGLQPVPNLRCARRLRAVEGRQCGVGESSMCVGKAMSKALNRLATAIGAVPGTLGDVVADNPAEA